MKWKGRAAAFALIGVSLCNGAVGQGTRQRDEDLARDYNNIAAQHYNDGEYDRALPLYDKAIALNPRAAVFYNNRAAALEKADKLASALSDYDAALRLDPSPAVFYSNRAALLIRRNDVVHAIVDYDEAVEREPQTGFFRQERGKAKLAAGDRFGALADFKAAVVLDSKLDFARLEVEALSHKPATAHNQPKAPEARMGSRVALVIGNSDYQSVGRLENPQHDAELLTKALRAAGFTHVDTLVNGSQAEILAALNKFETLAAKSDWALVYYSGHGAEAGGVNYLLPVDIKVRDNIEFQNEAIPLDMVLSSLQRAATLRLVILDACRSDPFKGAILRSVRTRAVSKGLAPPPKDVASAGLLVAYAAKGGEVALDGPPGGDSPFAQSLAARIGEPGLELGKLFRLVRDDVLQATKGAQEPYVYGSLSSDDLYIHPH